MRLATPVEIFTRRPPTLATLAVAAWESLKQAQQLPKKTTKITKVNFGRKCILCGKREDAFKFALLLSLSLTLSLSLFGLIYMLAESSSMTLIIRMPTNIHCPIPIQIPIPIPIRNPFSIPIPIWFRIWYQIRIMICLSE